MTRLILASLMWSGLLAGHGLAAPSYVVRFPAPQTHYAEVEATFSLDGPREIMLPVWTPGSYLVREYARHIEGLTASDAKGPVNVTKTRKNRWRIDAKAGPVTVKYRVYGREMSVRTNFFDHDFALISPAATFLTVAGASPEAHDVQIELPTHWKHSATGLGAHPDKAPHHYRAKDYDELVDSPIVLGVFQRDTTTVQKVEHTLVTTGGHGLWDNERASKDLATLIETQAAFWGEMAHDHYVFLNLLVETGGGLEHLDSTVLMTSRWQQRTRENYVGWLRLASHEYFHTWNVKRLRPAELGPFDYETENTTRGLWIAEGITSYYDNLLLRRSGLSKDEDYLKRLSKQIKDVQTAPGRSVMSLADASFDAWIKFYRPDENSRNVSVSYYTKGGVVAWLLDTEIRRITKNRRTLDDVMRLAWARHRKDGMSNAQFEAVAAEVAGKPLKKFFDAHIRGTAALDFKPALAWFGLQFKTEKKTESKDGDDPTPGWLGLGTRVKHGALVVSSVPRDTPGYAAGFNVGDELIAFDEERVPAGTYKKRLKAYPAGTEAKALVARRGRLRRLPVKFGTEPSETWALEIDPKAKKAAVARRTTWLNGKK